MSIRFIRTRALKSSLAKKNRRLLLKFSITSGHFEQRVLFDSFKTFNGNEDSKMVTLPNEDQVKSICQTASSALADRMFLDQTSKTLLPKICATCDVMITIDNPSVFVDIRKLVRWLNKARASREHVQKAYENPSIVSSYKVNDRELIQFVLSPSTYVQKGRHGKKSVLLCRRCESTMESKFKDRKKYISPECSIWNYNLVGEPPECLKVLRPAEVALISPNHIFTHAIVLRANRHDGIYGWHSMFENRVDKNIGTIQYLIDSGLKGEIICVFCGPFDKTQYDAARSKYSIRPCKVIEAFEWLKANNHFFRDIAVPDVSSIQPVRYQFADD